MKVSTLDRRFTERARFALWDRNAITESSGCYALANVVDEVLYIGETNNLRRRFEQHRSDHRMNGNPTIGQTHWFYFFTCPESERTRTEDGLLSVHKFNTGSLPPLNRKGP